MLIINFILMPNLEERIKRRYKELIDKGDSAEYQSIQKDMLTRDKQDKQREIAPLKAPDGAIIIDSTNLSAQEVVEKIIMLYFGKIRLEIELHNMTNISGFMLLFNIQYVKF